MNNWQQEKNFKRTWAEVVQGQRVGSQGASNDSYDQRISHQASINSDPSEDQFFDVSQSILFHPKANTQHPNSQKAICSQNIIKFDNKHVQPPETVSEIFDLKDCQLDFSRINQNLMQDQRNSVSKLGPKQTAIQKNKKGHLFSIQKLRLLSIKNTGKVHKKCKSEKTYDKFEIQQLQSFCGENQLSMDIQ